MPKQPVDPDAVSIAELVAELDPVSRGIVVEVARALAAQSDGQPLPEPYKRLLAAGEAVARRQRGLSSRPRKATHYAVSHSTFDGEPDVWLVLDTRTPGGPLFDGQIVAAFWEEGQAQAVADTLNRYDYWQGT